MVWQYSDKSGSGWLKGLPKGTSSAKKSGGSSGLFGTGVGPDVSLNDIVAGPVGVVKGFAGLGALGGATLGDLYKAGYNYTLGDNSDVAGKALNSAGLNLDRFAVGAQSSAFSTLGDLATAGSAPFLKPIDLVAGTNFSAEPGNLIRGAGKGLKDLEGEANQDLGDAGSSTFAQALKEDPGPQSFSKRVQQSGWLAPAVEDVGNVAIGAGVLGRLGEATGATVAAEGDPVADISHRTGKPLNEAGEFLQRAQHPLKGLYSGTLGKLAQAVADRKLGVEVDPTLQDYYNQHGAEQGLQPPHAVDPRAENLQVTGEPMAAAYADQPPDVASMTPEQKAAYAKSMDAMIKATSQQYDYLTRPVEQGGMGITHEVLPEDPYIDPKTGIASVAAMVKDMTENQHLGTNATTEEQAHPYMTNEQNDQFRAVHDAFGHARMGNDVTANGEEIAYQHHAQMYPEEAQPALAAETRGQNSWLHYSPENLANTEAGLPKVFGPQNAALMPEEMTQPEFTQNVPDSPTAQDLVDRFVNAPPGKFATALAGHIDPQGVVGSILDRLNRSSIRNQVANIQRELARQVESARNLTMHEAAAQTTIQAARYLVDTFKVGNEEANHMVATEVWNRGTGIGPYFDSVIAQHPEIAPFLDQVGLNLHPISPEMMTPELDEQINKATDLWQQENAQHAEQLSQTRIGGKGLENINEEAPSLTKSQQKALKEAQAMQGRAVKLLVKAGAERQRAEILLTNLQERGARMATEIQKAIEDGSQAVDKFDRARAPKGFTSEARWQRRIQEIVDDTEENGGHTYNPAGDRHIFPKAFGGKDGGWSVSLLPKSQFEVPISEWATSGGALIDQLAKGYQRLFENPDYEIGTWKDEENGVVHVDVSQHRLNGLEMTRDQAMLLGAARNQKAIFGLQDKLGATEGNGLGEGETVNLEGVGSPLVASQITNELGANPFRDRTAAVLRGLVDAQHLDKATGEIVQTYPNLTHEMIDDVMARRDFMAYNATLADPVRFKNPEAYYKTVATEAGLRPSAVPLDALRQTFLNRNLDQKLWDEMSANVANAKEAQDWYFRSHDGIESAFRGKTVEMPDGTTVDQADLMYDLLALTSVSADPITNMGSALTALANTKEFTTNVQRGDIDALMKQLDDLHPKARMANPAAQAVTDNTHMYGDVRRNVAERILGNKPLASWTEDDIRQANARWGGKEKTLSSKVVPEGTDWGEYHGSSALAKIRAFEDNLRNPATSTNVTLDSWMARLFGEKNFERVGVYSDYAQQIRDFASQLSEQSGGTVMPHEVQAALWAFAKQEVTRQVAGEFRLAAMETAQQLASGKWTPKADPIDQWLGVQEKTLEDARTRQMGQQERASQIKSRTQELVDSGSTRAAARRAAEAEAGPKGPGVFNIEAREGRVLDPTTGKAVKERIYEGLKSASPDQNATLLARRLAYDEARTQMHDMIAAGDLPGAQKVLSSFVNDRLRSLSAGAENSDFASILDNPTGKVTEAGARIQNLDGPELFQHFGAQINGATWTKAEQIVERFFQTADYTTFAHEDAHALRMLLPTEQLDNLERSYGIRDHNWTVPQEERFAEDMVAYMNTGEAPKGLESSFTRTKSVLQDLYSLQQRRFGAQRLTPEVGALFDKWFENPAPSVLDHVPGTDIKLLPGTNTPVFEPEPGTIPQRAQRAPNMPEETAAEGYRRGVAAKAAAAKFEAARTNIQDRMVAIAQVNNAIDTLQKTLSENTLPSALEAQALSEKAAGVESRVNTQVDQAAVSRWPRQYMPIGIALDELGKAAKEDPALAGIMDEIGTNFSDVLKRAQELGLNPEHFRDFTDAQVRKLVWDTVRLGRPGEQAGHEFAAGTRAASTGMLQRTGTAARSIEALTAAIVEVEHEARTNELTNVLQRYIAQPIKAGEEIPKGYTAWDPVRRRFLDIKNEEGNQVASPGTQYVIPKEVDTYLRRMGQDYNHGVFKGLSRVMSPWKSLVLTLSPHFYINHILGHMVLTLADGAPRVADWVKAWDSFKSEDSIGRFADVPAVRGHSFVSDMGNRSMVPTRGLSEAWQSGEGVPQKLNLVRQQLAANMRRAVEVTDGIARSAIYHKVFRQTGDAVEALNRAHAALVDYNDLSPFEQQVVRSVVPFYGWQKGILKIMASLPVDHPIAAGLTMQLGALRQQQLEDMYGTDLPSAYAGVFGLSGGKAGPQVNIGRLNPFSEGASLITPEGIASSINPFLTLALRKAFNAPNGGFVTQRTVNAYGQAVPDVNEGQTLSDLLTTTPGASEGTALTGNGQYPPLQSTLKFAGINYMTPADVARVVARTKQAKKQVASNAPFPAKIAKPKSGKITFR